MRGGGLTVAVAEALTSEKLAILYFAIGAVC